MWEETSLKNLCCLDLACVSIMCNNDKFFLHSSLLNLSAVQQTPKPSSNFLKNIVHDSTADPPPSGKKREVEW